MLTLHEFERTSDLVANNVDMLCENIMLFSPRVVKVGGDLDNDTAERTADLLAISYPRRFQFYVNNDDVSEERFAIYAKYA